MLRLRGLLSLQRGLGFAKKLARVTAYFGFVGLVFLALGARKVWGAAEKSALDVGQGLIALGDVMGPTYRVLLNGEAVNVSSATTDQSIGEVLDRFEKECREHSGGMEHEFETLSDALKARMPDEMRGSAGIGVMRKATDDEGVVGCLARDGDEGRSAVAAGLQEFARTGDLSALGHLRYVVAERREDGKTHVVTAWTDGPFRIGSMFPEEGDAPGSDPDHAVRPPDSRRVLTAGVAGSPFGVNVYDSGVAPEAVLAHYDATMGAQGWATLPGIAEQLQDQNQSGRAYTRDGVDVMVFTQKDDDGRTVVSIVSMPPR